MYDPYKHDGKLAAGAGCFLVLYILGFIAFWGAVGFVVLHFIAKVW